MQPLLQLGGTVVELDQVEIRKPVREVVVSSTVPSVTTSTKPRGASYSQA